MFSMDFVLFFLAGIVGMFTHWGKRWVRGQTGSTLYEYIFVHHPKYTAYALTSYVTAIGAIVIQSPDMHFGTMQALVLAYTTGYGIDSAVNKDLTDDAGPTDVLDKAS